jgi:hypothetical protein
MKKILFLMLLASKASFAGASELPSNAEDNRTVEEIENDPLIKPIKLLTARDYETLRKCSTPFPPSDCKILKTWDTTSDGFECTAYYMDLPDGGRGIMYKGSGFRATIGSGGNQLKKALDQLKNAFEKYQNGE